MKILFLSSRGGGGGRLESLCLSPDTEPKTGKPPKVLPRVSQEFSQKSGLNCGKSACSTTNLATRIGREVSSIVPPL